MKTSKKTVKTGGPSKIKKPSPKKHNDLTGTKESSRLIPDEDDDFEVRLDDDIKEFNDFDDLDDDDDDDY